MCAEFAPRRHIRRALQIPHRRRPHPRPPPSPPPSTTRPSTMTTMRTTCPAPAHRNTRRRYSSSSFKPPPPRARIYWRVWCVCRRLFFFYYLSFARLPTPTRDSRDHPLFSFVRSPSSFLDAPFLPFPSLLHSPSPSHVLDVPLRRIIPPPSPSSSFLPYPRPRTRPHLRPRPLPQTPQSHWPARFLLSLPTSPILAPLYPLLAPPLSPSSLARLLISKLTTLVQVRSAT
ncbi:hypothetical protein B0H16DRAFT_1492072, partial [Mycena metata]